MSEKQVAKFVAVGPGVFGTGMTAEQARKVMTKQYGRLPKAYYIKFVENFEGVDLGDGSIYYNGARPMFVEYRKEGKRTVVLPAPALEI